MEENGVESGGGRLRIASQSQCHAGVLVRILPDSGLVSLLAMFLSVHAALALHLGPADVGDDPRSRTIPNRQVQAMMKRLNLAGVDILVFKIYKDGHVRMSAIRLLMVPIQGFGGSKNRVPSVLIPLLSVIAMDQISKNAGITGSNKGEG